jgi:hypothetical protein
MNAPEQRPIGWVDANQRLLVAEFARLKARLAGDDDQAARAEVDRARAAMPAPAAIDQLARVFGLSSFETGVVLLGAGAEMDSQLAALCGRATGQPSRACASFGLALSVLEGPHWSALAPESPLRRWRLVELDEGGLLTTARLRVDEPVLHVLAGVPCGDPRVATLLQPVRRPVHMAPSQQAQSKLIAAGLTSGAAPVVQLFGDDVTGREDVAAAAAAAIGCSLESLDIHLLPTTPAEIAALATLCEREALFAGKALLVECGAEAIGPALRQFLERLGGVVFIGANEALTLRRPSQAHRVNLPPAVEQHFLWRSGLAGVDGVLDTELNAVVSQFSLSARRIAAAARDLASRELAAGDLWNACRGAVPAHLTDLAQRVDARADWDDLILPEAQKQVLRQIITQMRRRFEVHDNWGFAGKLSRGLGITALFSGDSGTGKTLAAEVLANALKLELYRIDLSAVVSKYIGETEKNLRRVFDAAEHSGAILLFDEADALFGKRSEVRDSHDRYANIEVSYLLQRMECYRGLAILTTNQKAAIDSAFMRRLRFVVHFPFPEATEREAIWRRSFPPSTPTRDLAYSKLARLQTSGGHIQNIALAAAFMAADAGEPVGMVHLLRAAQADAAKRERTLAESETRSWA